MIVMKKPFKIIMVCLALSLAVSLCGCQIIEGVFQTLSNTETNKEGHFQSVSKPEISGVYIESSSGKCLAFDPVLPDMAFSGDFDQNTGEFTASEMYACRKSGNSIELYKADPPYFAADYSSISYQLKMSKNSLTSPDKTSEFMKWGGKSQIVFNESLAQFNKEVSFTFRTYFFSYTFFARNEPAPQTDFMPQKMDEDVGTLIINTVVEKEDYYARSTLTKNEKAFYDAVYNGAYNMKAKIDVEKYGIKFERAIEIIRNIFNDAPELFWCTGWWSATFIKDNRLAILSLEYEYSSQDAKALQTKIDAEAASILISVDSTMSEYQKFMKINEELGKRIEYDQVAMDAIKAGTERADNTDQTIVGGLVESKAVCEGITNSLQYLLHKVGIQSYAVNGSLPGGNHSWNMIKIEGQWYYADLTQDLPNIKALVVKDYLMTEKEISPSYSFTMLASNGEIIGNPTLPECISHRFDNEIRNPAYFKTLDGNSVARLKSLLFKALQEGKGRLKVYFENEQDAAKASKMFAEQYKPITADIPAFNDIAVCFIFSAVGDDANVVEITPVYRIVPVTVPPQIPPQTTD